MAYVRFALDHPGHYAVMFDHSLVDPDDADLIAAQDAAGAELARVSALSTIRTPRTIRRRRALAAWSLVHGFSLLWLNEAIDADGRSDRDGGPSRGDAVQDTVACGA